MARACPSGPGSRSVAGAGVGLEHLLGGSGVLVRELPVGVVPVVHGQRVVVDADPGGVLVPLAEQHRPLAGGDGVVEAVHQVALLGEPARGAPPRPARRRGHPVREPPRRTPPPGCGRRTGRRRVRPRWHIAARGRRRRPRGRGAPGPRGRGSVTLRGRSCSRRWNDTPPPGGSVPLIAMRQRSWRKPTPRGPRRISPAWSTSRRAGRPMPRGASRWSGIASGAHAMRWSTSQASGSRPLVRASTASRTVRGISRPSWSSISAT